MSVHDDLRRYEGLLLKPYRDSVGKWTIGYGRNLEEGISEAEANILLDNDIIRADQDLRRLIRGIDLLSQERKDVLTNMMFNIGATKMAKFKKMLRAIEARDFEKAAAEMINSRWAKQVGQRAVELAEVMRTGHKA